MKTVAKWTQKDWMKAHRAAELGIIDIPSMGSWVIKERGQVVRADNGQLESYDYKYAAQAQANWYNKR